MELQGEQLIPAGVNTTWAALNDPVVLKICIAGCESLERTGDDAFAAVVALKVGPVSARFKGNLKMTNIEPPNSYTINFDGQGGVAGFGKGSADVELTPEAAQTRLKYAARAQVGGKMAQVGSRLIDATAAKISADFFKAFEAHLRADAEAAPRVAEPAATATEARVATASAAANEAPIAAASCAPALAAPVAGVPARREAATAAARVDKLWWVAGAAAALALVYLLARS